MAYVVALVDVISEERHGSGVIPTRWYANVKSIKSLSSLPRNKLSNHGTTNVENFES